ncbi:SpAN-like 2, partial [Homarus americanus]
MAGKDGSHVPITNTNTLRLILTVLLLQSILTLVRARAVESVETAAAHMPLCPAHVSEDDDPKMKTLINTLPLELLNPPKIDDDKHLFEGDIVMDGQEWHYLERDNSSATTRKAIKNVARLWPVDATSGWPTIHYVMTYSVLDPLKVRDAMDVWEKSTCVKFVKISDGIHTRPFIKVKSGSGCYSFVGNMRSNAQVISLGQGCYNLGTILHELGHVLGLYHEQSRADRNDYIGINFTNVQSNMEKNFLKEKTKHYGVEYDFTSIMHYHSTAFSKNGRSTIVTKDPTKQIYLGQRSSLTFRDVNVVNQMYSC